MSNEGGPDLSEETVRGRLIRRLEGLPIGRVRLLDEVAKAFGAPLLPHGGRGPRGPRVPDLVGKTFGMLTVIKRASNDKRGKSRWHCECACGRSKVIPRVNLLNGSKSCGCLVTYARPSSESIARSERRTREQLARELSARRRSRRAEAIATALAEARSSVADLKKQ